MKTKQTLRMIGSALLCTAVSTSFFPVYAQQDNPTEKTETVFTVLNPDGALRIRMYPAGFTMKMELKI